MSLNWIEALVLTWVELMLNESELDANDPPMLPAAIEPFSSTSPSFSSLFAPSPSTLAASTDSSLD